MAQSVHPTLFRLGWTKQSNHLWYSFQNSQYGTLLIQDLLWRQSLEGAFLRIGFFLSDLILQRTSQGILFSVQIYYSPQKTSSFHLTSHRLLSTGLTPSFRQPQETIPSWQVYRLCLEFQRVLEVWTGQPVTFRIEWVPTWNQSATLMAKQLQSLLEKKVSIKRAIDTVLSSRSKPKKFPLILPGHSYGSLMNWVWIAFNSMRALQTLKYLRKLDRGTTQKKFPFLKKTSPKWNRAFQAYSSQKTPRISGKTLKPQSLKKFFQGKKRNLRFWIPSFPSFYFKKKRLFQRGHSLPFLLGNSMPQKNFQRSSQLTFPKIYRSSYLTQYWIVYLKWILQSQTWCQESFRVSSTKLFYSGDKAFQKGIERYTLWGDLSPSLLHLGDFILSSQFQIRQGRFWKYRLSGRLKGVDMAQTLQGQWGSYRDPYALQMEQLSVQTPWGTFGLSLFST